MKRCTKTMSGKHSWQYNEFVRDGFGEYREIVFVFPKCFYCKMIDDRPKKGKK